MSLFSRFSIANPTTNRPGLQILSILALVIVCSLAAFGLSPAHGAAPEPKPAARPAIPLAPRSQTGGY